MNYLLASGDLMFLKYGLFTQNQIIQTKTYFLIFLTLIDLKLKAMVYLHDIQLEHGPIHLGKVKKEINIEQKEIIYLKISRKRFKSIDEDHLENILTHGRGAGDIVFFDTTQDKAGIVKEGFYRKY